MSDQLKKTKKKTGGRSDGKISVRHRGGGHKQKYRQIDFRREKHGIPAKVAQIEYDPNRSADVALLHYQDGEKRYMIAPQGLKAGDKVITKPDCEVKPGNRLKLKNIPSGTQIYNIELSPQGGAKLVRSAGNTAQLMSQEGDYSQLKLPSEEIRLIHSECFATIGEVSNPGHSLRELKKAGESRWRGRRPHVRGTAMPASEHPHGGGEGRTGVGRSHPKTPEGKHAHGKKTRKSKPSDKFIVKRRNE
jgi:large subunit ribosomal protein L2